MKKILFIIIAVSVILSLVACGGESDETIENPNPVESLKDSDTVIMQYEDASLDTGMYAFIFSYSKGKNLYYYQQYSSSSVVEDTQSFWSTSVNGKTLAEVATEDINNYCKMLLISEQLVKQYGVSLDSGELDNVEAELNDLISFYGSTTGFSDFLKRYGITIDEVEELLNSNALVSALQDELCGTGGLCEVTEKEVKEEITSSYGKATHIYLKNASYDGNAKAKAEEILSDIQEGADFEDYVKLSDDTTAKTYPEGTLFKFSDNNSYADTVSSLSAEEYGLCEMNDGVYVIKAFDFSDDDIDTLYSDAYGTLADKKFSALMAESYGLVELNTEELAKYDIVTADVVGF